MILLVNGEPLGSERVKGNQRKEKVNYFKRGMIIIIIKHVVWVVDMPVRVPRLQTIFLSSWKDICLYETLNFHPTESKFKMIFFSISFPYAYYKKLRQGYCAAVNEDKIFEKGKQ